MGCGRVVHRPVPDLGCFTGREYGVYVLKWLPLRVLWWLRDTVTAAVRVWSLGPAPSARRSCGQQTNNQKSKTWLWLKARPAVCILPPGPQSPEVSPSPSQRAGCPPCRCLSTSSGAPHSALSRLPCRSPGVLCTWPLGAPLKPGWKGRRQGGREGDHRSFETSHHPRLGTETAAQRPALQGRGPRPPRSLLAGEGRNSGGTGDSCPLGPLEVSLRKDLKGPDACASPTQKSTES